MLTNHPILMGADYHHDIQRLQGMLLRSCIINLTHDQNNYIILITGAKFGGKELLSLDKESAEQFGLSTEFQTPLMKFIEDLVCHRYKLSL